MCTINCNLRLRGYRNYGDELTIKFAKAFHNHATLYVRTLYIYFASVKVVKSKPPTKYRD